MLDHRTGSVDDPHRNPFTGEFVWTRASNRFGWSCLRGDYEPGDGREGWFSPTLARRLEGLPPALILTGALDLFYDENLEYARRLCAAGVPVELHAYAGAVHGFIRFEQARVSRTYRRDLFAGVARMLAPHAPGRRVSLPGG
jgi:triacylglycerol lipase